VIFLARTGFAMLHQILSQLLERFTRLVRGVRHDRRRHDRIRVENGAVIVRRNSTTVGWGCLLDISEQAFTFVSAVPLEAGDFEFRLICQPEEGRRRVATGVGHCMPARREVRSGRNWRGDYCYLVFFRPCSHASHYVIDRYFLRNCVVFARSRMRLWRGFAFRLAIFLAAAIPITAGHAAPRQSGKQSACAAAIAVRPYGPEAAWNVPAAKFPRHPGSDELAALLWNDAPDRPGNFNLSFDDYTYAVYDATDATGSFPIAAAGNLRTVPWNPAWRAPPGADAQIIVLDPRTGREWNLFQAAFDGTQVYATNANLVPGDYRTRIDGFAPSRGIGIPYLAMLVRPGEIAGGCIAHAMSMPIRNPDGRIYVAPATKLEHRNGRPGIPEGTRFALHVTDNDIARWLASLPEGLPPETLRSARIIAQALRDYGWFITDTAGSAHLQFEARVSAGQRWAALGLQRQVRAGKEYPRDLLDGLIRLERIYALAPPVAPQPG
jgi:hypothetical protein